MNFEIFLHDIQLVWVQSIHSILSTKIPKKQFPEDKCIADVECGLIPQKPISHAAVS